VEHDKYAMPLLDYCSIDRAVSLFSECKIKASDIAHWMDRKYIRTCLKLPDNFEKTGEVNLFYPLAYEKRVLTASISTKQPHIEIGQFNIRTKLSTFFPYSDIGYEYDDKDQKLDEVFVDGLASGVWEIDPECITALFNVGKVTSSDPFLAKAIGKTEINAWLEVGDELSLDDIVIIQDDLTKIRDALASGRWELEETERLFLPKEKEKEKQVHGNKVRYERDREIATDFLKEIRDQYPEICSVSRAAWARKALDHWLTLKEWTKKEEPDDRWLKNLIAERLECVD
jgi:hypothetical protein